MILAAIEKRINLDEKHLFCCYIGEKCAIRRGGVESDDKALCHRLVKVLRFQAGKQCIFFDACHVYYVELETCSSSRIVGSVISCKPIKIPERPVNCILPLLEKQYLESALYACAQYGMREIRIAICERSHRTWGKYAKDWERARAILVAACEQSKQFNIPTLFPEFIQSTDIEVRNGMLLVPEMGGQSLFDTVASLRKEPSLPITFTCGPEAGFTTQERAFLIEKRAVFVSLGSAILRSSDVVAFLGGITRVLLNS